MTNRARDIVRPAAGAVAAVLLGCVGCVGAVSGTGRTGPGGADQPRPGPHDPGSDPADPPPGSPSPPSSPPPADCATGAGAAVWHSTQLTREQYINTAFDLLGFDVRPQVAFDETGGRRYVPGVALSALEIEQRATTAEAIAALAAAPARWPGFVPCDPGQIGEDLCATQLIEQFGTRAFRGPLSPSARTGLRALFDAGRAQGSFATGVEWLVAGVLQAPDFLYQLAPTPTGARPGSVVRLDDATLATRLAFLVWNSGPDLALLSAAAHGDLRTPDAVATRALEMLADPRAERMRADHYGSWLALDRLDELARDPAEFTPGLVSDLRRSLLAGVEHLYQSGAKADTLWNTPALFVNDELAKLYGLPAPSSPALAEAAASPEQRHGLLTHPALLTLLAHPDTSDPIARGVFVEESVLCRTLPDPAADIPELPPLKAGLSTRQRLEKHRSDPACAGCHTLFDPIGLGLENYDAIGRFRSVDHDVPVDSSGDIQQGSDLDGKFANGIELLTRIGSSASVRDCMVQRWFEYALRRDLLPSDQCAVNAVKARFAASGDLLQLVAAVARSESFQNVLIEE